MILGRFIAPTLHSLTPKLQRTILPSFLSYDTWSSGRNISNNVTGTNEVWNIACYNDNDATDTTSYVTIDGWTTSADNYLKIFTPYLSSEVGASQRHNGTWGNGYRRTNGIAIKDSYVRLDGLSNKVTTVNWTEQPYNIYDTNGGELYISNSYGETVGNGYTSAYLVAYVMGEPSTVRIWNSIGVTNSSDTGDGNSVFIMNDSEATVYLYNNTAINKANTGTTKGYYSMSSAYAEIANCIGFSSSSSDFIGDWDVVRNSISFDNTVNNWAGPGNIADVIVEFVDMDNNDFRLAGSDTVARDYGANLSADPDLAFTTDIQNETRTIRLGHRRG